jgi:hypothetical protein
MKVDELLEKPLPKSPGVLLTDVHLENCLVATSMTESRLTTPDFSIQFRFLFATSPTSSWRALIFPSQCGNF